MAIEAILRKLDRIGTALERQKVKREAGEEQKIRDISEINLALYELEEARSILRTMNDELTRRGLRFE